MTSQDSQLTNSDSRLTIHDSRVSSPDIVISVKNLSKKYRRYGSVADAFKEVIHPFRKKYHDEFWALKDVSFEIKKGESVGIIGRNGSGKSTLLQILCGILQPTSGEVKVHGRVSALLELGAGFHPQFTGRENVYLNGAIMGLTKEEIDARFNDVIEFADIGDFIDQPVRTYSSGMYVRLAFSVAIHVEPDILVVDEALAVGDISFQKKCFDRLNLLKADGKTTIIFVSHAVDQMKSFPSKALLLDKGHVSHYGDPGETVLKYMQRLFPERTKDRLSLAFTSTPSKSSNDDSLSETLHSLEIVPGKKDNERSFGAGSAWLNWIKIFGLERPNIFTGGETIGIKISFSWNQENIKDLLKNSTVESNILVGITFETKKGIVLTNLATALLENKKIDIDPLIESSCVLDYTLQMPLLAEGDYFLSIGIALGRQENLIPLKRIENIVHLYCSPKSKYVFGLMNWNFDVSKQEILPLSSAETLKIEVD